MSTDKWKKVTCPKLKVSKWWPVKLWLFQMVAANSSGSQLWQVQITPPPPIPDRTPCPIIEHNRSFITFHYTPPYRLRASSSRLIWTIYYRMTIIWWFGWLLSAMQCWLECCSAENLTQFGLRACERSWSWSAEKSRNLSISLGNIHATITTGLWGPK